MMVQILLDCCDFLQMFNSENESTDILKDAKWS